MGNIVIETIEIARNNFKEFGFENEQIIQLLESGKSDLTKELNKLQVLLKQEPIEIDKVNLSLHALKGLFLTMGNVKVAEKLNEFHNESDNRHRITDIKHLLEI